MAAQRYYYSDSITDFLSRNTNEIVGKLTLASQHDINDETSKSWVEEIETMREVLAPYEGRGSVYFEYIIPRMGRRVDVIAVIDGIIFVLEYKTAERNFSREALVQVWDYAIDLKNFQEGSLERILIPILVVPSEKGSRCQTDLKHFGDYVYEPLQVNSSGWQRLSKWFLALFTMMWRQRKPMTNGPRAAIRPRLLLLRRPLRSMKRIRLKTSRSMAEISTRHLLNFARL